MQTSPIRRYILNNLSQHQKDIIKATIRKFGLSRQAVLRHMKVLILDGKVEAHGKTRDRYYVLRTLLDESVDLDLTSSLEEDTVAREHIYPHLRGFPPNVVEICEYGFTQMMNNIIVHSEGTKCRLRIVVTDQTINFRLRDDGKGIFHKISSFFGFENPSYSVIELAKGKVTTAPFHHTGEGIFFTTRLFDRVTIASNGLCLKRHTPENHWEFLEAGSVDGTSVSLTIKTSTQRNLKDVFSSYSCGEESIFNRTEIPVILARIDSETFMSRSQARRVLWGLDRFEEVCLDFKGVPSIGQPFADEIFRVYRNEHEDVRLNWMNASRDIEEIISRVSDHQ